MAGVDPGTERVEDALEIRPGAIKQSEVVQRPAAAQRNSRDRDADAGPGQHLEGGAADVRMEIVVEGVHPQDRIAVTSRSTACATCISDSRRSAPARPAPKTDRRQP